MFDPDKIRALLWSQDCDGAPELAAPTDVVLEQYKLYVEMTDRLGARRNLMNTFFLTLHTAVFTVIGVFWKDRPAIDEPWLLVFPLAVCLTLCAVWLRILLRYGTISAAKYAVIEALEERLPARPFSGGESYGALAGWGFSRSLTVSEAAVPVIFAAIYSLGFVFAVLFG
jgi:hypothetical protein